MTIPVTNINASGLASTRVSIGAFNIANPNEDPGRVTSTAYLPDEDKASNRTLLKHLLGILCFVFVSTYLLRVAEQPHELAVSQEYYALLARVESAVENCSTDAEDGAVLQEFLAYHKAKFNAPQPEDDLFWQLAGSFFFFWTVISTIGYVLTKFESG